MYLSRFGSVVKRGFKVPFVLISNPRYFLCRLKYIIYSPIYQDLILPVKVKKLRRKTVINVLFVLNELGAWKTETLYKELRNHPRFQPRLLLVPVKETPDGITILKDYLEKKAYPYDEVIEGKPFKTKFKSDIIFYQKPYDEVSKYSFLYNLNTLFCYVLYCFRNRNYPEIKKYKFIKFIWQFYAENSRVIDESVPVFSTKARNMVNTGIPIMDDFLLDKSCFEDPWKKMGNKKRFIYAPHHTITSEEVYEYATFLDFCDFMLEMAEKYKDQTQWAFKPHPVLKNKLYSLWGKEKTDDYYRKWETLNNCQVALGDYMGLFKYSDAMIHDCGSFKLEYLYSNNPVMYLQKVETVFDYSNWQTTEALNLHYKGKTKKDIEDFIINVINGVDPLKDDRKIFVDNYLTPPNGKSACENIINAILGEEEYKC
jgi:hypothetical protein